MEGRGWEAWMGTAGTGGHGWDGRRGRHQGAGSLQSPHVPCATLCCQSTQSWHLSPGCEGHC